MEGLVHHVEEIAFGKNYEFSLSPIIEKYQVIGVSVFGHDVTKITAYRLSLEDKVKECTLELNKALEKEKELPC